MKLVKTCRSLGAIFVRAPYIKRTAKTCFGLIAEVAVALGFVVVALIGALYALGCIAVLWLRKLGSELKALGTLVSARHRQPFAKTTVTGFSEAKEEVS